MIVAIARTGPGCSVSLVAQQASKPAALLFFMCPHAKQMATTDVAKLAPTAVPRRERIAQEQAQNQRRRDRSDAFLFMAEAILVFGLGLSMRELGSVIGSWCLTGTLCVLCWKGRHEPGNRWCKYVAYTIGCGFLGALGVELSYKLGIETWPWLSLCSWFQQQPDLATSPITEHCPVVNSVVHTDFL